jgi:IS30 family transposase
MDDRFQNILDGLPETPPRSCLEPVRELIDELRRRGRTYREVSRILAERCDIRVSVSTVHRFLHSRAQTRPQSRKHYSLQLPEMTKQNPMTLTEAKAQMDSVKPASAFDEIQQRIAALKRRPAPTETKPKLFHYDPNEPLHLPKKTGIKKSGE